MLHSRVEELKRINHMDMWMYKSWFICKFSRHSNVQAAVAPHRVDLLISSTRKCEQNLWNQINFSGTFNEGARIFQKYYKLSPACQKKNNVGWRTSNAISSRDFFVMCILKSKHFRRELEIEIPWNLICANNAIPLKKMFFYSSHARTNKPTSLKNIF